MINKQFMRSISEQYGFELTETQLEMLDIYAETLVEWNEKINLTAITDPDEIAVKHFLDSFLLIDSIKISKSAKIIDVGTGAGFPSVPSLIMRDDLKITLLDSLNKRINFLKELISNIGLSADFVHSRAEDGGKNPKYREQYDIATARAVAHMRELSEYCLPFVKVGGCFVSLKGYDIEQELDEAKTAIKLLGGKIVDVKKYELPNDNKRAIVIIKKISQTPTKFPRISAKIKKEPIK